MTLLRKYAAWLLLAAVAGIAGAWLIHAALPVRYLSSAQVDVEPRLVESLTPIAPNMGTEEQVATSGVVLARTARALHTTERTLAKDVTAKAAATGATATGTANILAINCTRPTAVEAQRCAAAASSAYLAFRNMRGKPKPTQLHDPLEITLITAATRPLAPTGLGVSILLPVGALLGMIAGFGAILVRDRFDHRVRDRADLERCLDAPVLATVPRVRCPAPTDRHPLSPASEAYRYLREHLHPLITAESDSGAVLLVAGAESREGRTCVAANLATAFAEAGARVILVDADMRHPTLSKVFGAGAGPGLTDLLMGRAQLDEVAVHAPDQPGLKVITAGEAGDGPMEWFQVPRLARVFREMRAEADVIVVDSAPVLAASQAITLARVSDLVVMVADVRRTEREAVSAAAKQIRALEPRIIVGVLNAADPRENGWADPKAVPQPESLAPSPSAPTVLAGIVPPQDHNGEGRTPLGPARTLPFGSTDTERDADSGEAQPG